MIKIKGFPLVFTLFLLASLYCETRDVETFTYEELKDKIELRDELLQEYNELLDEGEDRPAIRYQIGELYEQIGDYYKNNTVQEFMEFKSDIEVEGIISPVIWEHYKNDEAFINKVEEWISSLYDAKINYEQAEYYLEDPDFMFWADPQSHVLRINHRNEELRQKFNQDPEFRYNYFLHFKRTLHFKMGDTLQLIGRFKYYSMGERDQETIDEILAHLREAESHYLFAVELNRIDYPDQFGNPFPITMNEANIFLKLAGIYVFMFEELGMDYDQNLLDLALDRTEKVIVFTAPKGEQGETYSVLPEPIYIDALYLMAKCHFLKKNFVNVEQTLADLSTVLGKIPENHPTYNLALQYVTILENALEGEQVQSPEEEEDILDELEGAAPGGMNN